jgi:uncharacterized cofD-like protein
MNPERGEETMEEGIRLYSPGGAPRIVAIGGGHGLSTMLRGLKQYTRDIVAIVTTADDGGGSGMLRQDLGMLPPGDARDCVLALANTEPLMEQLMNYRFSEGSLSGQNFGNLLLAALNGICGSFGEAVRRMGEVLAITGRVLPVTEENIHLQAQFEDGSTVLGESAIFYHKKETRKRIRRVVLTPEHPAAFPEALEAIARADLILIGPGSLYTSIIPNFLVDGITEAVTRAKGYKLMVMNLMTQDGETEGYSAADHLRELLRHGKPGMVDACLANDAPVPPHLREEYLREGAGVLELDREAVEALGVKLYTAPLLSDRCAYARHDPLLLTRAIADLWQRFGREKLRLDGNLG